MTDISDLLKITPETLAEQQFAALKTYTVKKLRNISDLISTERFDEVSKQLFDSPAGDGYGLDSTCIDFSETKLEENADIGTVLKRLKELQEVNKKKVKLK